MIDDEDDAPAKEESHPDTRTETNTAGTDRGRRRKGPEKTQSGGFSGHAQGGRQTSIDLEQGRKS